MADYLDFVGDPGRDDVEGWLYPTDAHLMSVVNDLQVDRGFRGDVLEIGAYKGKSAILLGFFPEAGESLTVCDIFDSGAPVSDGNARENTAFYPGLLQTDFEKNYLRFHDRLPRVHVGPSEELGEIVAPGSCRLVHIDGGHTYEVARADMETARRALGPAGIVVVDDWSSAHIPGVAMALWERYLTGELIPLAFTKGKFYATWDPAGLTAGEVADAVATRPGIEASGTVRLGRYAAAGVTMTPGDWQRYNAGLRAVYSKLYADGGASAPQRVGF
ncbi:class I SAM-dependent methyltransferase [Solwaraspora sp. WMMA2065]|uniref:class I SAM-dependent methyltransferase n=1 Tax=Solwaraspora sp. WMMA2065 TaxID=3015166 RepID=UPI00259BF2BF|nr:class I SAM-dependent methyltransferase [Solwaraspora sp. WMMA2065]WJK33679.1 class I SAM-dependent methyltransferase [Solwaraspora sp. WMMA2065]